MKFEEWEAKAKAEETTINSIDTGPMLNENDPFERQLIKMVQTNRKKRADYSGTKDPWQNFYDSAYQVGRTAGESCEVLIATKQSRLRNLLQNHFKYDNEFIPNNEPIVDTLLDRAVYSVIAMALWAEDGYVSKHNDEA